MTRKNLLITNNHEDYTGGGSYVMMILNVLKKYYDIYTDKNVGYYHHPRTPWKLQPDEIQLASADQCFDLHLYADYHGWTQPRGLQNAQIIYYPKQKKMDGWDKLFVLNTFAQQAAESLYPGRSHIITPYFDPTAYRTLPKRSQIINVGHYFIESDGHSKNQHYVAEWFKKQQHFTKLIFHGKLTHPDYFRFLTNYCQDDPRIVLKHDASTNEIRQDLAESMYMIHAIGYGRSDPAQTEHFGLVAVEALLSGCQPIVHRSGGCPDIPGVMNYDNFDNIRFNDYNPEDLRRIGMSFNIDQTEHQLTKALDE